MSKLRAIIFFSPIIHSFLHFHFPFCFFFYAFTFTFTHCLGYIVYNPPSQYIHIYFLFLFNFTFTFILTLTCTSAVTLTFPFFTQIYSLVLLSPTGDFSHFRIFYSSNQSLNQSFANSQEFTNPGSKEQYCFENTDIWWGS